MGLTAYSSIALMTQGYMNAANLSLIHIFAIISAIFYVILNLIADIIIALDPRIRL